MFPLIFAHLSLFSAMQVSQADIGTAFNGVAELFATFLVGILAFMLVIEGYLYMAAGTNDQKSEHAKRAMGAAIAGGILVAMATGLAPEIVRVFGLGH